MAAYPCQGPEDVIDQAETGFMNESLEDAVTACLQLNRDRVYKGSHPESEKFWYDSYTWMKGKYHNGDHHTLLLEFVNMLMKR